MATKKSFDQLEADEKKLLEQLDAVRQGKRDAAKADADAARASLVEALENFNRYAAAAGERSMRLVSEERVAPSNGTAKKTRIRLNDERAQQFMQTVLKAIKNAGKTGIGAKDIKAYLNSNGWVDDLNYTGVHFNKIISILLGGDEPKIEKAGDRTKTKYFAR